MMMRIKGKGEDYDGYGKMKEVKGKGGKRRNYGI
jgi:hypothetical protein